MTRVLTAVPVLRPEVASGGLRQAFLRFVGRRRTTAALRRRAPRLMLDIGVDPGAMAGGGGWDDLPPGPSLAAAFGR